MQSKDIVKVTDSDRQLPISNLGWTEAETKETYYRLIAFKENWDAPGMEAYDEL